jgi:hypothetical protein
MTQVTIDISKLKKRNKVRFQNLLYKNIFDGSISHIDRYYWDFTVEIEKEQFVTFRSDGKSIDGGFEIVSIEGE